MKKVKLPHKVAHELEKIKSDNIRNPLSRYGTLLEFAKRRPNCYRMDTIMEALVNGYEIEQSPEEKVKNLYEYPDEFMYSDLPIRGAYRNGIVDTLSALNIEIKGVNA